ncbi:hypothetical protein LGQ03_09995 [Loktanella sp. TSTF-M6]|uniref:HEPN AbiU2-like domain-containing protein n=1 Tax=Loktanella gaetbuli TaxID=2881335 RepID=A0ABS8BUZ9_9RHOB|nr:hypothetical protein [Loktanella gaetbuli]
MSDYTFSYRQLLADSASAQYKSIILDAFQRSKLLDRHLTGNKYSWIVNNLSESLHSELIAYCFRQMDAKASDHSLHSLVKKIRKDNSGYIRFPGGVSSHVRITESSERERTLRDIENRLIRLRSSDTFKNICIMRHEIIGHSQFMASTDREKFFPNDLTWREPTQEQIIEVVTSINRIAYDYHKLVAPNCGWDILHIDEQQKIVVDEWIAGLPFVKR